MESAFSPEHLDVAAQKASYEFDMTPELSKSMWRLQNGEATRLLTVEVQAPRISMFELAVDHHHGVQRFNLRPPEGRDRREAVLEIGKEWIAVLWIEKVHQYEALRQRGGGHLPPLPEAWGPVDGPRKMPCVVWVLLPKPKKHKRKVNPADRRNSCG